jgi:hypothetical protein
MPVDSGNAALGRAMARVGAHEIYHMLTGSTNHARSGIARAEHSRTELTEASFTFAKPEEDWLRAWVLRQIPHIATPDKSSDPQPAAVSVASMRVTHDPASAGASEPAEGTGSASSFSADAR